MYVFKSTPYAHQAEVFERTRDLENYALFWEQGCGKTKPTIDTAAYLHERGEIDALMVVAPKGVDRNWLTDELPAHMPDRVRCHPFRYDTAKHGNKGFQLDAARLIDAKGLVVLAMSYDAISTEKGKAYAGKFMRKRRCLMVADESHYIKTPSVVRTKVMLAASKFAPYRRILTGTPSAQGPFDLYSQVKFVDDGFWKRKGISTFGGFKTTFGIFESLPFGPGGRNVEILRSYRNIDMLAEWLKEIGHRLTKDDALDLPEKIYRKVYVELSAEQKRVYEDLKVDMMTMLANNAIVEAPLAITQLLRFQQVVNGYVGDIDGNLHHISEDNPRLDALEELVTDNDKPGIIWARFTEDINLIMAMLQRLGRTAVRYDGQVDDAQRAESKLAFQEGRAQWFVGNQAAGATGLTLTQAKQVIYYSNSFRLVDRLQSEDRAHRIGQVDHVLYTDIVTPGTVDEKVVRALREKRDIASLITGDSLTEWI